MNVVSVEGISMRPLLITGDLLILQEVNEAIPFGSIVYVTKKNGEKAVHRFLGKQKVKGDRAKYWDEIKSIDFLVTERVVGATSFSLNGIIQRLIFGVLSLINLKSFFLVNHFSAFCIDVLGRFARRGKL